MHTAWWTMARMDVEVLVVADRPNEGSAVTLVRRTLGACTACGVPDFTSVAGHAA